MSGQLKFRPGGLSGRDPKATLSHIRNGFQSTSLNYLLLNFPGHPCDSHVLVFRGPVSPRTAEHAPAERCTLRGEGVEAVDLHLRKIEDRRFPPWETFVLNGANSKWCYTWNLRKKRHRSNLKWYNGRYIFPFLDDFGFPSENPIKGSGGRLES